MMGGGFDDDDDNDDEYLRIHMKIRVVGKLTKANLRARKCLHNTITTNDT